MCIEDRLAAYQFDAAVVLFGTIAENAAQEMHNTGNEKAPKWEPKYSLSQLLEPDFRLPALKKAQSGGADNLRDLLKRHKRGG